MTMQHATIEKSIPLMAILTLILVSIGGIVEIVPLFFIKSTIEKVDGMRPYTPLELKGRDIYIREGCYNCHSQMIRPFRDEAARYGHYSLAAESMYDHPFQWGSKRTGPDLARIGGKYSNEWHQAHMLKPQNVVPESVMPAYPWLQKAALKYDDVDVRMQALSKVGVPYSPEQIANAKQDLAAQAKAGGNDPGLAKRYGNKVPQDDFDGKPDQITELDALLAYLQMLGTLVDFSSYQAQTR
ncbi:MAG: cytochrome-c oxidase, cbb3-type subunit II [Magnetococcales bacterium]|nr:cytochrome-c oxidase, cbb3-type subunit II [Magnetococcales bacterium]MBF0438506.1 cytochrome-c oxidase, cbb3-type subunit II [Magnetococcales bacterium]